LFGGLSSIRPQEYWYIAGKLIYWFYSEFFGRHVFGLLILKNHEKQGSIVLFEADEIDVAGLEVGPCEAGNKAIRTDMCCAETIVSSINPRDLAVASFYLYNTVEEIAALTNEVTAILEVFK